LEAEPVKTAMVRSPAGVSLIHPKTREQIKA
jgi:hypothetical protein